MKKKNTTISAEDFDRLADSGSDAIDEFLDWSKATRPGLEIVRFNVDLPEHFLNKLDYEAKLRGITRQALVKTWLFRAWQTEGFSKKTKAAN